MIKEAGPLIVEVAWIAVFAACVFLLVGDAKFFSLIPAVCWCLQKGYIQDWFSA